MRDDYGHQWHPVMHQFWLRIWWVESLIDQQKKAEHRRPLKCLQARQPQAPKPHRAKPYNWH